MLAVLVALSLLGTVWNPEISTQVAIMSVGIATIGLGHGAMDHRVGEILMRPRFGRNWWIIFGISYLVLALVAYAGWILAPAVALIAFLVYSAIHFGSDRFLPNGIVHAACRGSIPLLLPIAFHSQEVSKLFSTVTSTNVSVEQFASVAGIVAAIAVLVTVVAAVRGGKFIEMAETVLLVALNFTCPPLMAFTVYFVLLHSIRHIVELAGWLEPSSLAEGFRRIARESLPLTVLLLMAGAIGISLVPVGNIQPAIIRTVFVGLSCLTVPHMIVTHLAEKHLPRSNASA